MLGICEALEDVICQTVDHIRVVVAFFTVITRKIGAAVDVPFSLDRGILWVQGKLIGGIFYGPSYGFL